MENIKEYQNWTSLDFYTKELKEWIWKLFRKVHARIGHVEEDLAKVRETSKVDYELIGNKTPDQKYEYVLYETITGEEHGKIVIDPSVGIHTVNWYDGSLQTAEFAKVYRWAGNRGDWVSNTESKWKNCLVFGKITESDGTVTDCVWAGNKDYIYETGTVCWDEPEFEGSERP